MNNSDQLKNLTFLEKLVQLDIMAIVSFTVVIILAIIAYKAQTNLDNKFDLRDLVLDKETGKVSLSRFGQFTALVVSTWGFVTLTVNGNLTEWYYASYMMIWAVAEGFRKWGSLEINKKRIERDLEERRMEHEFEEYDDEFDDGKRKQKRKRDEVSYEIE